MTRVAMTGDSTDSVMFEKWLKISESLLATDNDFKGFQNKGLDQTESSTEHHVDEVSAVG